MDNKKIRTNRRYDKNFKEEAIKKYLDTPGASIAQISKELNIKHGGFYNWLYNSKDSYLIKDRLPPRRQRQIRTETGILLRSKELDFETQSLNKVLFILKEHGNIEEIELKIKKNNYEVEELNKAISIVKKYNVRS